MVQQLFCRLVLIALSGAAGFVASPLVRADIAVVVHPSNHIAQLTAQDLKKIFLGRMSLFPDSGRAIRAVDLPDEHPLFQAFYRQVVELEGVDLKRYRAYYLFSGRGRLPVVATSSHEVIRMVSSDPAAIGYLDSEDIPKEEVRVILMLPHTP